MKYRTLGRGLEVSALGLGCMPMAGVGNALYGEASYEESIATINRAIELGV
ncbi:MAG: aldo/keto reductase, partial [Pseudomonadota bacterium]|nr:aldo/keto reductase [Pseudomonadota bacterium]